MPREQGSSALALENEFEPGPETDIESIYRDLLKLDGEEVWIQRHSGEWQKARVDGITQNGVAEVSWDNPEEPGKKLYRSIVGRKVLDWQKEAPKE